MVWSVFFQLLKSLWLANKHLVLRKFKTKRPKALNLGISRPQRSVDLKSSHNACKVYWSAVLLKKSRRHLSFFSSKLEENILQYERMKIKELLKTKKRRAQSITIRKFWSRFLLWGLSVVVIGSRLMVESSKLKLDNCVCLQTQTWIYRYTLCSTWPFARHPNPNPKSIVEQSDAPPPDIHVLNK